jgi:hypothetical protein
MRTETDPVSEMSCLYSLGYRTMEKVQKPSDCMSYRGLQISGLNAVQNNETPSMPNAFEVVQLQV